MESFLRKLPLQNKDSTIMMIKDSITDKAELAILHAYLIDTLYGLALENNKFAYIAYLEKNIDTQNTDVLGDLYTFKGKSYYYLGKTDSSFLLMNQGIQLLEKGTDSVLIGYAYTTVVKMYVIQNLPIIGTELALRGLTYIPKDTASLMYPKDARVIRQMLKRSLMEFYASRNYKKAKALALEQLHENNEDPSIYEILTFAFHQLHQEDSAKWAAEKQFQLYQTDKNYQTAFGAFNLAMSFKHTKQTERAIAYFQLAQHKADSLNIKMLKPACLINLGNVYLQIGDSKKAAVYYNSLLEMLPPQQKRINSYKVLDSLTVLRLKEGNSAQGLTYFYQSKQLVDSLHKMEQDFIWADMNIRYETSEKEKRIHQLELDKQAKQLQILMIAFLLFVLLSAGAWLYFRYRQKQILLESSKELLEVRHNLQEQEINANKAQLAGFQESITNKNALIDEMQAQMNELMLNSTCITQSEAERNREKLNELKILTDKDWRIYLAHFEKAYPGYIAKVEQHFPNLTKGELRFFLVVYLDFSKDEIATFLGVSLGSVNKNQYRLKKKLGLGEDSNLKEFIKKF